MPLISIEDLDALVFDFDGVLTDDRVYVDDTGKETVRCNRTDGIAFDILRTTPLRLFILTTERNAVATHRAAKLQIPAVHGVSDKLQAVKELAQTNGFALARTLYVGNDVNDFGAMQACGFSACPADSHPRIQEIARFRLERNGGDGVAREIVERVLGLDPVKHWRMK